LRGIDLEDCVVGSVDIGVDSQAEEMLVVMGVYPGVDFRSPALGVFTWVQGVGVQDSSELDFQLDGSILVEYPVHAVLVVRRCEDLGDDEFSASGNDD